MKDNIKISERGWIGHFICGDRCLFRRNTLIEDKKYKYNIVVSTVGNMVNIHSKEYPNSYEIDQIGWNRYYETQIFHANIERYKDINVSKQIYLDDLWWSINKPYRDNAANKMHDLAVKRIVSILESAGDFKDLMHPLITKDE